MAKLVALSGRVQILYMGWVKVGLKIRVMTLNSSPTSISQWSWFKIPILLKPKMASINQSFILIFLNKWKMENLFEKIWLFSIFRKVFGKKDIIWSLIYTLARNCSRKNYRNSNPLLLFLSIFCTSNGFFLII